MVFALDSGIFSLFLTVFFYFDFIIKGCIDYETMWITSTLRGVVSATVKV